MSTQSDMSDELCDGVRMLIERMQSNPEDFEFGGKLHGYRNTMEEVLRYPSSDQPMWFLSEVEKKALIKAYTDMHKQVFTSHVIQAVLNTPEPEWDVNMDTPYRNHSKIIAPQNMLKQAREILNSEFDKQYAKSRDT